MSGGAQTQAIRTGRLVRVFIYCFLLVATLFYLLPLAIMLVNSVKPLAEITGGNMVSLPQVWTIDPWLDAWSRAQIGVEATGLRPYFINSIVMVVPAVVILTLLSLIHI